MNNIPIQIPDNDMNLFGILRLPENSDTLVIFLPAASGTRIGPQRIYVHISNRLYNEKQIASLCIDIPPHGDSYDNNTREFKGNYKEVITQHYAFYIDKIIQFLKSNYNFSNVILCSISVGCIPILKFAQSNGLNKVILLSPNHLPDVNASIDKKNLKAYYYKLFKTETWLKLLTLNIQYKNVLGNILKIRSTASKSNIVRSTDNLNMVHVLCIFGERDIELPNCQEYWRKQLNDRKILNYDEKIIENADHSFFGWEFKEEVSDEILAWL